MFLAGYSNRGGALGGFQAHRMQLRGRNGQLGVSAHTDLLGLRHGGQLMQLGGGSWTIVTGVVGASLRTLSQKKAEVQVGKQT